MNNVTAGVELDNINTESDDVWETTPGGFCKTNIDLEDDTINHLIDLWVEQNLEEASKEQYQEVLSSEDDRMSALFSAVLNDMIIASIKTQIENVGASSEDI